MIVMLEIPADSQRRIREHGIRANQFRNVIADALETGVEAGAEKVRELLVVGELGLVMQNPASGLAASVAGWMLDRRMPMAAVGVPADSPAAAYAGIQNEGGTIVPKRARALAVPISDEAKQYTSPRDMQGLELIPRKGKPPLLVRQLTKRGSIKGFELHWVLVKSVTLEPTHWLDRGVEKAVPVMVDGVQAVLDDYAARF